MGSGGEVNTTRFYRLTVGPLVSYQYEKWLALASVGYFNESGEEVDGPRLYSSRGTSYSVGWERLFEISTNAEFAVGGFFEQHEGGLELASAITPSHDSKLSSATLNSGRNRGIEIALHVSL